MKILIFTESLTCGGKERRVLELIQYLIQNTDYEISLVITESFVHYDYAYELGVPIIILERKGLKYDPLLFVKFYRYCRQFRPDIIHSWGRMTTFYAIPTKLIHGIPLISSMIYDSQIDFKPVSLNHLFFRADIFFSDIILSNSYAGLVAYRLSNSKTKVIWNGVHLERFQKKYDKEKVKENLNVTTEFMLVMIAAFSTLKDYDLFLDVAKELKKIRHDVTLLGVGDGAEWNRIQQRIEDENISNVILTGQQKEVEHIIAASDIGILCTFSEGISNSIIESMALGVPVISTDLIGGSQEIIIEGETGYCVERNTEKIVDLINLLLNDRELRLMMGEKAKERIKTHFSIRRMGEEFELIYKNVLEKYHPDLTGPDR
jgi:glycosyltransferase involved in cell wall biosynthesis